MVLRASSGKRAPATSVALPTSASTIRTTPDRTSQVDPPAARRASTIAPMKKTAGERRERQRVGRDGVPPGQDPEVGAGGAGLEGDVVEHAGQRPDQGEQGAGGRRDRREGREGSTRRSRACTAPRKPSRSDPEIMNT